MANAERGEVELSVGGRTYTLRLMANAQAEIESAGPWSHFHEAVQELAAGSIAAARLILWGALREFQPKLTLVDAGNILDENRELVGTKLGEAINLAFPDITGDENPPKASPEAGRSS
jgi:hypothetical protein